MKLKKKTLDSFFLSKYLNPFFFELLIDNVRDFNDNLGINNKQIIKLRQSNKTVILFTIYLNIFSTKKINTQENEKRIYLNINRVNLIKEKQKSLPIVFDKEVKTQSKFFFTNLLLERSSKKSALQIIKSTQILKNLKMI